MAQIHPYLTFPGNTEQAFQFYRSAIGGEFRTFQRFGDMSGDDKMPDVEKQKIMHVALPIGQHSVLMGSDSSEYFGHKTTFGNNFSISFAVDSKEEATKIFNALSVGGNIIMPMADTFWGAYFGMLTDQFGVSWMVNYDYPRQ